MEISSFKDYRKKFDKTFEEIELLSKSYVKIGFQEESKTKSQVKGNRRKAAGESMAVIAAKNEYGAKGVPARPFMRTSFDENRQNLDNILANEYDKIIEGNSTVKRSLGLIGLYVQDLIQQKIRSIHTPPNSPRTIAQKKSSKPLIDFGQMVQSVRYKVVIEK